MTIKKTKKTLYMESTEISADRTAAEIAAALVKAGATQIASDYQAGRLTGLRWTMCASASGGELLFAMPARVEPIYQVLVKRREAGGNAAHFSAKAAKAKEDLRVKAERVAWRQLLRWVQLQSGRTVYESFVGSGFRLLAAPRVERGQL